jgi:predicted nuclease with TOPRIM domain
VKETEMDRLINAVIEVSSRITSLENSVTEKLESMDTKLESMDGRLIKMEKQQAKTNLALSELRHSIEQIETKRFDDLNKRVTKLEKTML